MFNGTHSASRNPRPPAEDTWSSECKETNPQPAWQSPVTKTTKKQKQNKKNQTPPDPGLSLWVSDVATLLCSPILKRECFHISGRGCAHCAPTGSRPPCTAAPGRPPRPPELEPRTDSAPTRNRGAPAGWVDAARKREAVAGRRHRPRAAPGLGRAGTEAHEGTGPAPSSGLSTCGHDVLPEEVLPGAGGLSELWSWGQEPPTRFQGHSAKDRHRTYTKARGADGGKGWAPASGSRSSKHEQPNTWKRLVNWGSQGTRVQHRGPAVARGRRRREPSTKVICCLLARVFKHACGRLIACWPGLGSGWPPPSVHKGGASRALALGRPAAFSP